MGNFTNSFKAIIISTLSLHLFCSQADKNTEEFHIDQMYQNKNSYKIIQETYDKELAKWPTPIKNTFISGRFGKTHLLEWGENKSDTIILIHGLSGNSMQWGADFVSEMSKSFHIISLETIGDNVGKSIPKYWPIERDSLKIWLHETLGKLNIQQANFVGLAMGGWLIQDFAMRYPEKVKSLTVIGAAGSCSPKFTNLIKILYNARKKNQKGFEKAYSYLRAKNVPVNKHDVQYFKTVFENCKPINHFPRKFKIQEIKMISTPTLIILGSDDCYFNSVKAMKWRLKHTPQNQIEVVNNAGHLMHLDKPLEISIFIKDFLLSKNY